MRQEPESLEDFYPVMTPGLYEFLSSTIPTEGDFTEPELEGKFRAICREVKRIYPDHCRDSESWIKTTHYLLFFDWTKTLTENPTLQTPSRLRAWDWLFDRSSLAIDRAEEDRRKKLAV